MASLAGANYYSGKWIASSWQTSSGYGWQGFGTARYVVLKITASTASESFTGRFRIQIPMYCASTMTYYVNCAVTTTAPNFSGTASPPSNYNTWTASVTNSYTTQTFYTPNVTITSGGTYYVWLWSTSSTVCYYGHSSSTGWISAVGYTWPNVSLSGYSGFYGGCDLYIDKSSYGYIYIGNGPSGTFYQKATSGTTGWIAADAKSTSKTIYVLRTDYDLGTSFEYYGGAYTEYSVPRFACAVYDGSSSYTVKSGNSGTITCSKSGYTFKGLSSSASSTSYSSLSFSSSTNGGVYYAVYTQSTTVTYCRGSSTTYTAYPSRYLYGTGSYTSWALTEPTRTCASNSNYSFQGWTPSYLNTTTGYSSIAAACNAGYSTIYGVYKKSGSSSNSTVYYYRGSSTKNSVTKTTTVADAYYYGKGSHKGGGTTVSYGTITSTCASDSSASLVGWTASSSSTSSSYSTATAAFDAGNGTIYGIFKKAGSSSDSTVYYYRGSSTKNSVTKTTTVADKYYYGAGSTSGGGSSYSYGSMTTTCASNSGYSLVGWATSSSSTSCYSTSATTTFNAGYSTIYGVYKKAASSSDSTVYYYRGSSTRNSVTKTTSVADAYYYGTGSHTGGGTSYSFGTITTDCAVSGWTFIGFDANTTDMSGMYTAEELYRQGYTTIYGVYTKDDVMTYYPQNGDESGVSFVSNFLYGTGQQTTERPPEPSLSKTNYVLSGWGTSTADTTADSWNDLWDTGTTTVYAIWIPDNNVYYGVNGNWKTARAYYGVDSVWEPVILRYGANSVWK